ncbi:hypothetical protein HAX54_004533, partial [Datura stramonium]|nr:hypothetical protein [Datura stramonium]
ARESLPKKNLQLDERAAPFTDLPACLATPCAGLPCASRHSLRATPLLAPARERLLVDLRLRARLSNSPVVTRYPMLILLRQL